ncbi:MAG: DnaA/Hda family protein [Planctomycetes bacterium]|nr:DnaA/Hda family protein [Planctomycetota bacterium]
MAPRKTQSNEDSSSKFSLRTQDLIANDRAGNPESANTKRASSSIHFSQVLAKAREARDESVVDASSKADEVLVSHAVSSAFAEIRFGTTIDWREFALNYPFTESSMRVYVQKCFSHDPGQKDVLFDGSRLRNLGDFVVGPSSRLAHANLCASLEEQQRVLNPIFIYSRPGLGKTTLLRLALTDPRSISAGYRMRYITAPDFVSEYLHFARNRKNDEFRAAYHSLDVLLIDDVHGLSSKESSIEEFFHIFNRFIHEDKLVVLTSLYAPDEIRGIAKRLVSRFKSGLVSGIDQPDFETKTRFLLRYASKQSALNLSQKEAEEIANRPASGFRELIGALNTFAAVRSTGVDEPRFSMLMDSLSQRRHSAAGSEISADVLLRTVCAVYKVKLSQVLSKARSKNIAWPRHVSMYLLREMTDLSLKEIGGFVGGKDHSTVLHAIDKVKKKVLDEDGFSHEIDRLKSRILDAHRTGMTESDELID